MPHVYLWCHLKSNYSPPCTTFIFKKGTEAFNSRVQQDMKATGEETCYFTFKTFVHKCKHHRRKFAVWGLTFQAAPSSSSQKWGDHCTFKHEKASPKEWSRYGLCQHPVLVHRVLRKRLCCCHFLPPSSQLCPSSGRTPTPALQIGKLRHGTLPRPACQHQTGCWRTHRFRLWMLKDALVIKIMEVFPGDQQLARARSLLTVSADPNH